MAIATARHPRLREQVRKRGRVEHYRLCTEKAYLHWIHRFIRFHGTRHPLEIGPRE